MAAPALPELPAVMLLPRCPTQPARPPSSLPRHVAPPSVAAPAAAEAATHTRLFHIDGPRGAEVAPSRGELPPLREAPLLPSRGGSRPAPVSRRGCDLDVPFDAFSGEHRAPAQRVVHSHTTARATSGRLALAQLEVRREPQDDGRAGSFHDMESLKWQVSQLTQLRHQRDTYIQDALAEVEAAQHRHESEFACRNVQCQREVSEWFAVQQREHDEHLEEWSHLHAAALAKQALQHEFELEELRKAVRRESERQFAGRLAERSSLLCDLLTRLQSKAEDLQLHIAQHTTVFEAAFADDQHGQTAGEPIACLLGTPDAQLWSSQAGCVAAKPRLQVGKPEAGIGQREALEAPDAMTPAPHGCALAPRTAAEEMEAGLAAEAALDAARSCLLQATAALASATVRKAPCTPAAASSIGVKRLGMASPSLCSVVPHRVDIGALFHRWAALAACKQHQSASECGVEHLAFSAKCKKSHPCTPAHSATSAHLCKWRLTTLHAWAAEVARARSQMAWKQPPCPAEAAYEALELPGQRKVARLWALEVYAECWRLLVIRSWAAVVQAARLDRACQHQVVQVIESTAELSRIRELVAMHVGGLCRKLQTQGLIAKAVEALHFQQVVLRAWGEACTHARHERLHQQHLARQHALLHKKQSLWALLVVQVCLQHVRHVVVRAWSAVAAEARRLLEHERQLARETARWRAEHKGLQEEAHQRISVLKDRLQVQWLQAARMRVQHQLGSAVFWWTVVVRDAHREAKHRHQLLIAAADCSAELFRVRNEGRRTTSELRKQRRAHGIAAVHASLDRRLQAVLHAWSLVARDAQREALYQRQLDIAAAESAAGCAVLRMEARRSALELQHRRRAQAFRWLGALRHCWCRAALAAWATAAVQRRRPAVAAATHCWLRALTRAVLRPVLLVWHAAAASVVPCSDRGLLAPVEVVGQGRSSDRAIEHAEKTSVGSG